MATLIEQLLFSLKKHGAGEIFGIPGDYVINIFRTIQDSDILPLYTLSHEPAIGFAADGAARYNRRMSAACITYGAGALNIVNPVAGAYAERVPIVVISGYPAYKSVNPKLRMHHELKTTSAQFEVLKNVTCDQARLDDISKAPKQISRLLENCLVYSRPVYLEISGELYNAECPEIPQSNNLVNFYENPETPSIAAKTLQLLKDAKKPLIILGYELLRFKIEKDAIALANKLEINHITTLMSRNIKGSPCFKGALGNKKISELFRESDVVLNLGAILNDSNFSPSLRELDGKRTIMVYDDKVEINSKIFSGIHIRDFLNQIALMAAPLKKVPQKLTPETYPSALESSDEPITSYDIIKAVNDAFNKYGKLPLVSDIGDSMISSMRVDADEIFAPWFYGAMGYAVPAGIGLQTSSRQRPLILVGDGDFQMTGWELCNCSRYGIDPIIIVFNNSSWGILNAIKTPARFNNLSKLNYAQSADFLGGRGYRAQTKKGLKHALEKAFETRGTFQLIDAVLDGDTNHVGILSELSKLIKGR